MANSGPQAHSVPPGITPDPVNLSLCHAFGPVKIVFLKPEYFFDDQKFGQCLTSNKNPAYEESPLVMEPKWFNILIQHTNEGQAGSTKRPMGQHIQESLSAFPPKQEPKWQFFIHHHHPQGHPEGGTRNQLTFFFLPRLTTHQTLSEPLLIP